MLVHRAEASKRHLDRGGRVLREALVRASIGNRAFSFMSAAEARAVAADLIEAAEDAERANAAPISRNG